MQFSTRISEDLLGGRLWAKEQVDELTNQTKFQVSPGRLYRAPASRIHSVKGPHFLVVPFPKICVRIASGGLRGHS